MVSFDEILLFADFLVFSVPVNETMSPRLAIPQTSLGHPS